MAGEAGGVDIRGSEHLGEIIAGANTRLAQLEAELIDAFASGAEDVLTIIDLRGHIAALRESIAFLEDDRYAALEREARVASPSAEPGTSVEMEVEEVSMPEAGTSVVMEVEDVPVHQPPPDILDPDEPVAGVGPSGREWFESDRPGLEASKANDLRGLEAAEAALAAELARDELDAEEIRRWQERILRLEVSIDANSAILESLGEPPKADGGVAEPDDPVLPPEPPGEANEPLIEGDALAAGPLVGKKLPPAGLAFGPPGDDPGEGVTYEEIQPAFFAGAADGAGDAPEAAPPPKPSIPRPGRGGLTAGAGGHDETERPRAEGLREAAGDVVIEVERGRPPPGAPLGGGDLVLPREDGDPPQGVGPTDAPAWLQRFSRGHRQAHFKWFALGLMADGAALIGFCIALLSDDGPSLMASPSTPAETAATGEATSPSPVTSAASTSPANVTGTAATSPSGAQTAATTAGTTTAVGTASTTAFAAASPVATTAAAAVTTVPPAATTAPPAATTAPPAATTVPPAATTAPATATTPATATSPPRLISGIYNGTPSVVQHPHACCLQASSTWDVLQFRNDATTGGEPGKITIRLAGTVQGSTVRLDATISATGEALLAAGTGMVAGFPGVRVTFSGVLDLAGLRGRLVVGENGALPGGMASIFDIDFVKVAER